MRVVLGELELMLGNNVGMLVEDDEPDRAFGDIRIDAIWGGRYVLTWYRSQESRRILQVSTWISSWARWTKERD
jgi:hypothetical protein